MHFLSVDLKFQIRESANTDEIPVVLIAVDDESIRQVGRWPWSREQIAALVDQAFLSGVKTLGFDIVFSEPQSHPWETIIQRYNPPWKHELIHPDQKLEDIFARHGSKIVLGVFPENKRDKVLPYQDYCRNEAFLAHNASTFVKLDNFSFVVLDHDDPFESIPFQNLFQPIFKALSQAALDKLQSSKTGDHSDTKNDSTLQQLLLNYCEKWLTQEDPFLDISQNFFSSLQPPITIEQFKTQVKQYPIPQYDRWTINLERFHSQVLHSASFAAEQDSDGKIRRYPLFYRTGNRLGTSFVPSLALQTYLNAHPNWQAQIHIVPDEKRIEQKKIATMQIWDIHSNSQSHLIPTDPKGRLMINFYGPRYSFYYVPAYELLRHQPTMHVYRRSFSNKYDYLVESKMVEKQTFLKNKIAILGVTATAVYDLRVTPLDKTFPGPEIHVHALANLMENRYLTEPSQEEWLMPYLILFYGIIICCVFTFTGPIWNGITLIGCLLGIVGFDTYLFSQKGIVVTSI
ncbi:MAG: CHASE2 domain-containing protein, partial [Pseudobdellovibrionaceae bacterium]|nr:CHASE2 domain-containing protein [Pseudobdellovibrionaceae bacterium]